jgi:hypothetical protein
MRALRLIVSRLIAWVLLGAVPAHASSTSLATVRGFFGALERHDFASARALTDGNAAGVVARLLDHMERQAARRHAVVELHVRSLQLADHAPDAAGRVAVDVAYDIEVFGKKWLVSWFARRLSGTASFTIDDRALRIVAIAGSLGP